MHLFRLSGAAVCALLLCVACARHVTLAPATPRPVVTGDYPHYGHAPDFSWIAGRMAPRLDGRCIYLVFGANGRAPWGGRIALIGDPETLDALPSGDMVVAFGKLRTAPHGACGAAAFDVGRIEEH